MEVTVRAMTQAECDAWLPGAIRGYAADHVRAGSMPADQAHDMSAKQFADLLPDGVASAEQHLLVAEDDGRRVGRLWLTIPAAATDAQAFVYDVQVDEAMRGRGYGRALMLAGERYARQHGAASMRLHVFGDNTVARRLYEGLDYQVTNVMMSKPLAP